MQILLVLATLGMLAAVYFGWQAKERDERRHERIAGGIYAVFLLFVLYCIIKIGFTGQEFSDVLRLGK